MANKKSTFTYNLAYSTGAQIASDIQNSIASRRLQYAAPFAEGSINSSLDVNNTDYTIPDYPGKNSITKINKNKGWLSSLGDFIFGDAYSSKSLDRLKNFDIKSAWNLFNEKRVGADLDSAEKELYDAKRELQDLVEALEYLDILKLHEDVIKRMTNGDTSNQTKNELIQLNQKLKLYLDYFKKLTKSDVFLRLFYNPDKAGVTENINALAENFAATSSQPDPKNNKTFLGSLANAVQWGVESALEFAGNISNTAQRTIGKLLPTSVGGDDHGQFTYDAIKKNRLGNDYSKLFDAYNYKGGVQGLQNKIKFLHTRVDPYVQEKLAKVKSLINTYKNGNFLFNPKNIDPTFRKLQEDANGGLIGSIVDPTAWGYSFAELGTSFSDAEAFAGMMLTNKAAEYATKAIAKFALKNNPYVAGAMTIAEFLEYMKNAENMTKAATALNRVETANKAIGMTAAGLGMYWTRSMRLNETNGEAINAMAQRVLDNSISKNVDINKLFENTEKIAKRNGDDISNLDELEKFKYALAYNVSNGEPIYDQIKQEARKGIAKLVNENNAMAVNDYLQALPFMDYTRSAIKGAVGSIFSKQSNNAANLYLNNLAKQSANGVVDNAIQRAINKSGLSIGNKLLALHISKYIKRKLPGIMHLATTEALEEGRLQLLLTRYGRGEYDNYNVDESAMYLPSIWENLLLDANAATAYLGINFGDPDNGDAELRRSMLIGAMTSLFFKVPGVMSNLHKSSNDNVRNLLALLKNDRVIRSVVANNYLLALDDNHVGTFFDSFSKFGVTRDRLRQSLLDMKNFKGDLVSDDYIDRDIDLLNTAWFTYNNKDLNETLKALNIKRNSADHKAFVQAATRAIIDSNNAQELTNKAKINIDTAVNNLYSRIDTANEDNAELYSLKQKLKSDFQDYSNRRKQEISDKKNDENVKKKAKELFDEDLSKEKPSGKTLEDYIQQVAEKEVSPLSEKEYTMLKLSAFVNYKLYLVAKLLSLLLKLQLQRLNLVRNETGTDINTDRLTGMIKYLEDTIKTHEDNFNNTEEVKKFNKYVEEFNKTAAKKDRLKKASLEDGFVGYGLLDNEEEIKKLNTTFLINSSINSVLSPIAKAFRQGAVEPDRLFYSRFTPSWSMLSELQKILFSNKIKELYLKDGKPEPTQKLIIGAYLNMQTKNNSTVKSLGKKYAELRSKFEGLDSIDLLTPEDLLSIIDMEKLAALDLIQSVFTDKLERKRIAHRENVRNSYITEDLVDAAINGDELANADLEEAAREQEESELKNQTSEEPREQNTEASITNPKTDDLVKNETLKALSEDERKLSKLIGEDLGLRRIPKPNTEIHEEEQESNNQELSENNTGEELQEKPLPKNDDESQSLETRETEGVDDTLPPVPDDVTINGDGTISTKEENTLQEEDKNNNKPEDKIGIDLSYRLRISDARIIPFNESPGGLIENNPIDKSSSALTNAQEKLIEKRVLKVLLNKNSTILDLHDAIVFEMNTGDRSSASAPVLRYIYKVFNAYKQDKVSKDDVLNFIKEMFHTKEDNPLQAARYNKLKENKLTEGNLKNEVDYNHPEKNVHITNTHNGYNEITPLKEEWLKKTEDVRKSEDGWHEKNGLQYIIQHTSGRGGDNVTIWFKDNLDDSLKNDIEQLISNSSRLDKDFQSKLLDIISRKQVDSTEDAQQEEAENNDKTEDEKADNTTRSNDAVNNNTGLPQDKLDNENTQEPEEDNEDDGVGEKEVPDDKDNQTHELEVPGPENYDIPEHDLPEKQIDNGGNLSIADLTPIQQEYADWESDILDETDLTGTEECNNLINEKHSSGEKSVTNNVDVRRYIDHTFFYLPDGLDPMELKVDGNPIAFPKGSVIRSGSLLSQKLVLKGWFEKCEKFYVVSLMLAYKEGNNEDERDSFTVSLILKDGNDIYVTAMRSPGNRFNRNNNTYTNGRQELISKLKAVGVDPYKYRDNLELAKKWYFTQLPEELKNGFDDYDSWFNYLWSKDLSKYKELNIKLGELARSASVIPGKRILTHDQCVLLVEKLIETRNLIIDQYCTKDKKTGKYKIPKKVKMTVKPAETNISNGSIQTRPKINGMADYVNLTSKEANLGIPSDIQQLTLQLEDGILTLGFGTGVMADEANRFIIRNVFNPSGDTINGFGLSGQIYITIPAPSGDVVPVMLRAQTFRNHDDGSAIDAVNMDLAIDPESGEIIDSAKLTMPELILYMITNKINTQNAEQYIDKNVLADLQLLVIHTTLASKADSKHRFLRTKELYFDEEKNNLVLGDESSSRNIRVSIDDLFDPKNDKYRRAVIRYISKNMHWNTEVEDMSSKFYKSMPQLTAFLRDYFEQNQNAKSYKFFGLKLLEFFKDDLFKLENGELVDNGANIAAWMIKNGKLVTDISPLHFYAPFVYASGVASNEQQKKVKEVKDRTSLEAPSIKETVLQKLQEQSRFKKEAVERFANRFNELLKRAALSDAVLAMSEEANKKATLSYRDRGIVYDNIILDITKDDVNGKTEEEVKDLLKQHVLRYIDYVNEKEGLHFDINRLKFEGWTKLKNISRGYVAQLSVGINGDLLVKTTAANILLTNRTSRQEGFTGIFSKFKSEGKFDLDKARKWLSKKLGLDESNVVVMSGLLKSFENETVYGVTNLALDSINNTINGVITLSDQAGAGIHYHEAWHFVNLLMHDKITRVKLYSKYVESHQELKKATYEDIEEHMAEDFRRYAEMLNSYSIKNIFKRMYNSILDLISVSRKKDIVRQVFKAINSGKYLLTHMDLRSIKEFENRYPNGVMSADYYIPTVSLKLLDRLNGIKDYQTFYSCGVALALTLLRDYGFRTPADITNNKSVKFNELISDLKENNKFNEDPISKSIIDDIVNNPKAFEGIVANVFSQYGIRANVKKFSLLDETNDKTNKDSINDDTLSKDIGDRPDNVWDVMQLAISKKDNVAFRAKLFLSLIEKGRFVFNDEEKEREYEPLMNDILQDTPLYWSFGEAWSAILTNLWMCETYDDKDSTGNFSKNSIRGKVQDLANKLRPIFYALNLKLEEIEGDIELQNQILSTVKSSYNQVALIRLQDPIENLYQPMDDSSGEIASSVKEVTRDERRLWNILNDNTLKAKRNNPRLWSQEFASSNIIETIDGSTIINPEYVDNLLEIADNIRKSAVPSIDFTTSDYALLYDRISTDLCKLLNFMGIPFGKDEIDAYAYSESKNYEENGPEAMVKSLLYMLGGLYKKGRKGFSWKSNSQTGSILYFLTLLKNSKGLSSIKTKKNKEGVTIDKLYVGYGVNTPISKMASAYSLVNPSSSDIGIQGPDGSMLYPISENNEMSDKIRHINDNQDGIVEQMMLSPYAKHSKLLNIAKNAKFGDSQGEVENKFKLNAFVGIKDMRTNDGNDYFGITPLEDYIAKMVMMHNNLLVLPTMADKKTWYSISYSPLTLNKDGKILQDGLCVHDLISWDYLSKDGSYNKLRFSRNTLERFFGYFLDELESVEQYYSRDNIKYFVDNPKKARDNYHGKIKNGRMDMSGNGGMFRYFYDVIQQKEDRKEGLFTRLLNINQYLEFLYEKQKLMESDPVKYGALGKIREDGQELDGFELVRQELRNIRESIKNNRKSILDGINRLLFNRVNDELVKLDQDPNIKLLYKDTDGAYSNRAIPEQILQYYHTLFGRMGRAHNDYDNTSAGGVSDCALSAVANNVANTMISVIETEKVFAGDPAFFKAKYAKTKDKFTIDGVTIGVRRLNEKDSDKIKRLGSLLSPGLNLRTSYSESDARNHVDPISKKPELLGSKYTVLNIDDIVAKSKFLGDIETQFGKQVLVNEIRSNPEWFEKIIEKQTEKDGKKRSVEGEITKMYLKDGYYKEILSLAPEQIKLSVEVQSKQQAGPYNEITVSDALVCIRPALYRKIRIALGNWTIEPDESGYSDEIAYEILETDAEWMYNPEKSKMVSKLLLFPLKMTYFLNSPIQFGKNNFINMPVYNKMAIFPMFKYATQSDSGRQIYERMNKENNEIDMIAFESAVKVGDNQNRYSPYNSKLKVLDGDITTMDDAINNESDTYIDRNTGKIKSNLRPGDKLGIQIQDLNGLRMQLNTDAHEALERAIGTLMFKLAFSNLLDDSLYGLNKGDWTGLSRPTRSGRLLKADLMACINAMSVLGISNIQEKFFNKKDGKYTSINQAQVRKLVEKIVRNNGLGVSAEEIIHNGGVVASLMSRKVFELSVFSAVSKEVIDINTKGGSAVQQSIFGFNGFSLGKENIQEYSENSQYHVLNEGKELKWLKKDGSMEVMLSINFFRAVVPIEYLDTYSRMRQWLIEHDIINGTKIDGTQSHPKPFGIGYRIPTQGMSSMFSMTIADVLPSQSGDTIVVPREFTALTGSDFDVDKLFIATMSYKDGVIESISDELQLEIDKIFKGKSSKKLALVQKILTDSSYGAIQNRLLLNYIDIISDTRNISNSRGSIDTVTDILKGEVLPYLQYSQKRYRGAMYELTPSFQARRKMEFSTGKDGIGPFALNVTNMALTLFMHLSMRYGENEFDFNDLDKIDGQDGLRISDWLSAMVNAHVDVAKDPYIFDLNINLSTYNHVNFLLRAGKGKSVFSFIALPILKRYGEMMVSSKGSFGKNLTADKMKLPLNEQYLIYNYLEKTARDMLLNHLGLEYLSKLSKEERLKKGKRDIEKIGQAVRSVLLKELGEHKDLDSIANDITSLIISADKDINWKSVFDFNKGIYAIQNIDSLFGKYFLLLSILSFKRIKPFADELADLVKVSKIDTKKFGNNISSHINFKNTYEQFKYGDHRVDWYITTNEMSKQDAEKAVNGDGPTETTRALMSYFHNLFLDTKFYNSVELVQKILSQLTFTATPLFLNIIRHIFASMDIENGVQPYNKWSYDKSGNPYNKKYDGYKLVMKDDVIQAVAGAVESVLRFRSLIDCSPKMSFSDNYTGPIDFTFGGDILSIKDNYRRIMYGDKNSDDAYDNNTIFLNIAQFMQDIINDPYSEDAEGLTDENGLIKNELLNFLRPNTSITGSSVGRMTLAKTLMNVAVEQKQRLMSAFDLLLSHPSDRVRRLARDIAVYAYYSTYDTNSVYSFFDIVPPYYRKLYDIALKNGLNSKFENNYWFKNEEETSLLSNDILDIISRNLYKNEDIVKTYFESKKDAIPGTRVKVNGIKGRVPGVILGNNNSSKKGSVPKTRYFKITYEDKVVVYKYIGDISGVDSLGKVRESKRVYIPVPKFGIQTKGTTQYEFIQGSEGVSIFNENQLPDLLKYNNLEQVVLNYSKLLTDGIKHVQQPKNFDKLTDKQKLAFEKQKQLEVVLYEFRRLESDVLIDGAYYETNPEDYNVRNKITNEDGSVEFRLARDPLSKVSSDIKNSGIDINLESTDKLIQEYKLKIIERLKIGLFTYLHFYGDMSKFKPSNKQISDEMKQLVSEYEDRLDSNLSKKARKELINKYKLQISLQVEAIITERNIFNAIDPIIKEFVNNGANNITVLSSGKSLVELSSAKSAILNQSLIESSLGACIVYTDPKTIKNQDLLQQELDKYVIDNDVILSTDEQDTYDDINDAFSKINNGLQEVELTIEKSQDVKQAPEPENEIDGNSLLSALGADVLTEEVENDKEKQNNNKAKDPNSDENTINGDDLINNICK